MVDDGAREPATDGGGEAAGAGTMDSWRPPPSLPISYPQLSNDGEGARYGERRGQQSKIGRMSATKPSNLVVQPLIYRYLIFLPLHP